MNCSRIGFIFFVGFMGVRASVASWLLSAAKWLDPFCVGDDI